MTWEDFVDMIRIKRECERMMGVEEEVKKEEIVKVNSTRTIGGRIGYEGKGGKRDKEVNDNRQQYSKICYGYQKGSCRFGNRCKFEHAGEDNNKVKIKRVNSIKRTEESREEQEVDEEEEEIETMREVIRQSEEKIRAIMSGGKRKREDSEED